MCFFLTSWCVCLLFLHLNAKSYTSTWEFWTLHFVNRWICHETARRLLKQWILMPRSLFEKFNICFSGIYSKQRAIQWQRCFTWPAGLGPSSTAGEPWRTRTMGASISLPQPHHTNLTLDILSEINIYQLDFLVFSNIYRWFISLTHPLKKLPQSWTSWQEADLSFLKAAKVFAALWYFGRWERNELKTSILETSLSKHFMFSLTLVALGLSPVIQQHLRTLYTHKVVIHWCTCRDHLFGSQEISNEWWHVTDSQTLSLCPPIPLSHACSSVQFLFFGIYFCMLRRCKECINFCIYLKHLKPSMQNCRHVHHKPYLP